MKILLSGSTGFIGTALFSHWQSRGHHVTRLVRGQGHEGAIGWNPELALFTQKDFEGFDAVVHLAGEPIAGGRWSDAKKEKIFSSRVQGTKLLAEILVQTNRPPQVFISISAVGYYGDAGERALDEEGAVGQGFLPKLCQEWERAADPLAVKGCRVVHPRFGVVLGPQGGILQKLKPIYRWGLGATFGCGKQWISWISLDDLVRAFDLVLDLPFFEGAVNFTAPHPIRQEEFSRQVAHALHRPCFLKIPAWFLRLILGQMAEETLLASARVYPKKLLDQGFLFSAPFLSEALQKALETEVLSRSQHR